MRAKTSKALAAATLTMLLPFSFAYAPSANSTEAVNIPTDSIVTEDGEITPQMIAEAFQELSQSDIPRTQNEDGTVSFHLKDGVSLALPDPTNNIGKGFEAQPMVNGGKRDGGFWVEFTSMEQDMIISGSGFALGAAICAIPGVGQAACIVVGAVLTAATVYLSHHRACPGTIRLDYNWWGTVERHHCV